MGIDAESRLVISVITGKRTGAMTRELIEDFAGRTGNVPPALITTDDCSNYASPLLEQYGNLVTPERTGRPGRPRKPYKQWPEGSAYATVNKDYRQGGVAAVDRKLVYGTGEDLAAALEASPVSAKINTSFIERQNGTDRCHNSRKARKTLEFSKDLVLHIAVTWLVFFGYNFCRPHRGLRRLLADGSYWQLTPAMAAGLADHPLTMAEILTTQVVGFAPSSRAILADFNLRRDRGPAP